MHDNLSPRGASPLSSAASGLVPAIATGLTRLATVASAHEASPTALIDAIIDLLTDSLDVGLLHLARLDGETLHYDRVADRAGMGLPQGTAVPVGETYCATLLADDAAALIIEDARADPRVADKMATRLLGIGSYSGVPLYRSDGRLYGTLCTLHPTPRRVPEGEIALLQLAGRVIMQAVETLSDSEGAIRTSEERFRALTEQATDLVLILDIRGVIRYASPSHQRLLGYAPRALEGRTVTDLVHPEDVPPVGAHALANARRHGQVDTMVFRLRHADGSWRTLEAVGSNRLRDPALRGWVVNSRDITERAQAMEALRLSEAALAAAQELVHLGSWEQDLASGEMRWSDEAYRLLGYAPGSVVPTPERYRAALHPEDRVRVIAALGAARATGTASSITFRVIRPDGVLRVVQSEVSLLRDETGAPRQLVGSALDVTARQEMEEALRHQAQHDALTNLPNRTLLDDRLAQAILAAARRGRPLALLLLDLDCFKEVNDTLGHHAGDLLLQSVAARLRRAVRATDTVARLGGDEFAVLIPLIDDAGVVLAAHKLLAALKEPIEVEGQLLQVGASLGIALCPAHGTDAQTLLRRADVALYVAKRARGSYAVYAPMHDAHSRDRLAWP